MKVSDIIIAPISVDGDPVVLTSRLASLYGVKRADILDILVEHADCGLTEEPKHPVLKDRIHYYEECGEFLWNDRGAHLLALILYTEAAKAVFEELQNTYFCRE